MKIAFSTLGCPGWSFNEIFATAKDLGLNGIEVRGIGNEMYAPHITQFNNDNLDNTMAKMKAANLIFSCLTSACDIAAPNSETNIKEAKEYIDLAEKIGAPYVRIMCEKTPGPTGEKVDLDEAAEIYKKICDYAKGKNVFPLIETNGVLANSDTMVKFLNKVGRDNAFVLWDIHHPYRFFGEKPEATAANIGDKVKYIHVKDSVMENKKVSYRMMGYGDVPILDTLKNLKKYGYDGFVSLEWVKRWCPDLQEPGIVFSHYINYMQYLIRQL